MCTFWNITCSNTAHTNIWRRHPVHSYTHTAGIIRIPSIRRAFQTLIRCYLAGKSWIHRGTFFWIIHLVTTWHRPTRTRCMFWTRFTPYACIFSNTGSVISIWITTIFTYTIFGKCAAFYLCPPSPLIRPCRFSCACQSLARNYNRTATPTCIRVT